MYVPSRVAIVALGPTAAGYVEVAQKCGHRFGRFDQTWVINKFAGILEADLIFHMDDFRVQEVRAAAGNTVVAGMLGSMKVAKCPIITSREYSEYPTAQAFPLQDVINNLGFPYFNGTCAYAIAYAAHIGVKELNLFGMDFAWEAAPKKVERGRGCCEYWIGRCHGLGMQVNVISYSTLLDGGQPQFYGYDTCAVKMEVGSNKLVRVSLEDRPVPTAEEMEKRYDHTDFANLKVA